MCNIVAKYGSLVEGRQCNTNSGKDVYILALTSHIQELNILFTKQSAFQERNRNNNGGKKIVNNSGISWKTIAPTSGEILTKENNGRTWHWYKCHKYWTVTRYSKKYECKTIPQQIRPTSLNFLTKIN